MANVLGLSTELEEDSFGIDMPDEVKAQLTEKEVRPDWLVHGNRMRDIRLDANTLVMMIRRGDDYIVPKGDTELRPGDKVLCITGEKARLPEDYAVSGREGFRHKALRTLGSFVRRGRRVGHTPDGADDGAFVSADSGAETPLPDFDIGTDEIREDSRFYEEIMEDEEDAERRGE